MHDERDDVPPAASRREGPLFAVFDADLTLTRRPTWSSFLLYANEGRPMSRARMAGGVLKHAARYKLGLGGTRQDVREAALRHGVAGRLRAEVDPLADAFTDELMAKGLRRHARAVVEAHRAAGHTLMIASAGVDLLIDRLADRLGIEHRLHTPLLWEEERLAERLGGASVYAGEKVARVRDYLEGQGGRLVAFYSDHKTDLPLIAAAERGVAVNPSPTLRREARAANLPIENWDAEGPPASVAAAATLGA